MTDILKRLFIKYKHIISYVFFGAVTSAVNWISYYVFYNLLKLPNSISTIISSAIVLYVQP